MDLPAEAAQAIAALRSCDVKERSELAGIALGAVGYPEGDQRVPLLTELTPEQRAVVMGVCDYPETYFAQWAVPMHHWCRRRWLGLAPPTVLERPTKGAKDGRPLWHALLDFDDDGLEARDAFFAQLALPLAERLDAYLDLAIGAYRANVNEALPWGTHADIDASLGAWGAAQAERWLAIVNAHDTHYYPYRGNAGIRPDMATVIMLAVVRGGVPIEPPWDALVDVFDDVPLVCEILRALPEPRRTAAILERMPLVFESQAVASALALLPHFPSRELTQVVLDRCSNVHRPKREVLKELGVIAEKHAVVRIALDAFKGKQPKAIKLTVASDRVPNSVTELTDTEREQLLATGDRNDPPATTAEERFRELEGTLRIRHLVTGKKKPAYDVFTYLADDGRIYTAGTTDLVAWLVQDSLDTQGDVALHEALQSTLKD